MFASNLQTPLDQCCHIATKMLAFSMPSHQNLDRHPWISMGIFAGVMGCGGTERAPDAWPDEGCTAESASLDFGTYTEESNSLMVQDETELAFGVLWPKNSSCVGAVVLVPPGYEKGLKLLHGDQAAALAEANIAVVSWDPRGRGDSGGEEDHNGNIGQDDLAELLRWTAYHRRVDPSRVVLYSRSFGGALAAGALARHADLRPIVWLDYESPGFLEEDLAYASDHNQEGFASVLVDVEDADSWWSEREPASLIPNITTVYHRVQGLPDHALGTYLGHVRAMLDNATSAEALFYNGDHVTNPLSEDDARDNAIAGGLDPTGNTITNTIITLFQ
jgi:pimeloyl-ACP methyl ester carboxylesterase